MKLILSLVLVVILNVCLIGCENTVSGFGKDMQNTGKEIQKSAGQ